jgi:hypothetical protein
MPNRMIGFDMQEKHTILVLLTLVFLYSIFSVNAVSRDYDWQVSNTHYTVNVIVENPQFDSPFNVVIQLTLTSKDSALDHTETKWIQVLLSSSDKPLQQDSGQQNATTTLRNIGDSLQKTFSFQVSSSQFGIGRGQGFAVSIVYRINLDEFDNVQHRYWNHIGDNVNDPMIINLSMPLLSTLEIIIVVIILVIIIILVARFIYLKMRKRRMQEEERLRKDTKEKRRAKIVGDNFECPFCHTLYDKKLDRCPTCGAAKKVRD